MKIMVRRFAGACFMTFMVVYLVFTSAAAFSNEEKAPNTLSTAVIVVTDPETNRVWTWEEPIEQIQTRAVMSSSGYVEEAMATIDATEYVRSTYPTQSQTINDEITLTTGLRYSVNASKNTISLIECFGSYFSNGMFYGSEAHTWWRNTGNGIFEERYPTTKTWSYVTDSSPANYIGELPPFSAAECTVRVTGMSGSRVLTIFCRLYDV